jgi:hypothetical protein
VSTEIDDWIRGHVQPTGPIEVTHDRPWAVVSRVPVAHGSVWFKQCGPLGAFEPRLVATLSQRWPALLPGVLGWNDEHAWLLLEDAGVPVREVGNPPTAWLTVLPAYAEMQRGETTHVQGHLAAGVPDLRAATLPARYAELLTDEVPFNQEERASLAPFEQTFGRWCDELADGEIANSVQHDDLHHSNLFIKGDELRILDWGDTCIAHPFASLVVTFQFLTHINGLAPDDLWYARLRDAYLEPWGGNLRTEFDLAMRVGTFAHAIAWRRQRLALPAEWLPTYDEAYRQVLELVVVYATSG